MRVETKEGLLYDDKLLGCNIEFSGVFHHDIGTQCYAFVRCIDIRAEEKKYYWGPWYHGDPEFSMRAILERGGKWPKWPDNHI